MAKIDIDKFVASIMKCLCMPHREEAYLCRRWIYKALDAQGLKFENGEIVKNQRRIAAEAKEALYTPEVESEDERIRKRIIYALHGDVLDMEETNKAIAWIEKQGNNRAQTIVSNMLEDKIEGIQRELIEFLSNSIDASWVEIVKSADLYAKRIENMLKQGEQKPVKVPKFKVGDFIQFNGMGHTRYTIKEVCGLSHYINSFDKRMDMAYTDANFELVEPKQEWSEEDEQSKEWILEYLYDGLRKSDEQYKDQFKAAIAWLEKQGDQDNNEDVDVLQRFSFYYKGIGTKILKMANEVPTTMQCNYIRLKTESGNDAERLYKENGYNTLKKEGNQVWLENRLKCGSQVTQAWSEEDENCLSIIIAEFSKCSGKSVSKDEWMRCNDFLNSLKDKVQLKREWSEEDEKIYQSIMDDTVQENQLNGKQTNWLRDIKYRYFPQSKQEWNEEDEKMSENILSHLREYYVQKKGYPYVADLNSPEMEEFGWFKTLKKRLGGK